MPGFIRLTIQLIFDRYEPIEAPKGQNIITTTRSHSNKTVVESVKACEPSEILGAGGCGHKVQVTNMTYNFLGQKLYFTETKYSKFCDY